MRQTERESQVVADGLLPEINSFLGEGCHGNPGNGRRGLVVLVTRTSTNREREREGGRNCPNSVYVPSM